MNRRQFLAGAAALATNARAHGQPEERQRLVAAAEALKPKLQEVVRKPVRLVNPIVDTLQFLRWRMEDKGPAIDIERRALKRGDEFILDLGGHLTGYLRFRLVGEGAAVDSPVRLKLVFGEVPGDVAVPLESYSGTLSRA